MHTLPHHILIRPASLTCIALLLSFFAHAQIVDIEKKRFNAGEDGLKGTLSIAGTFTKNTREVLQFNSGIHLQHKKKNNTFLLISDIALIRSSDENWLNRGFQHLRYNCRKPTSKFSFEAFLQHQYNRVQRIGLRALAGSGLRISFIEKDQLNMAGGLALMYEHEEQVDGPVNRQARLSSYFSVQWQAAKKITLKSTTYYQPHTSFINDYRIASQAIINIDITDRFSFKVTYNLAYNNKPPEEVPTSNYSLLNGISYRF